MINTYKRWLKKTIPFTVNGFLIKPSQPFVKVINNISDKKTRIDATIGWINHYRYLHHCNVVDKTGSSFNPDVTVLRSILESDTMDDLINNHYSGDEHTLVINMLNKINLKGM